MRTRRVVLALAVLAVLAVGAAVALTAWPGGPLAPAVDDGTRAASDVPTATGSSRSDDAATSPSGGASSPGSGTTRYVFPVADCETDYAATHHDYPAADIFADRGCPVVSPVSGVVDHVSPEDRWDPAKNAGATRGGRSFAVVGDDGVRYYGSHLASIRGAIRPGVRVEAGERIGRVGDSGSAAGTGTHLHFGISWPTDPERWWIRRGAVPPQPYLDSWRTRDRDRSPARAVARAERRAGPDPRCEVLC